MKILMAVDGSDHTKRMLSYVAAHDTLLGRGHDYTFFNVVTPIPPHASKYLSHETLAEYYDEQAAQVFKPILAFAEQQGWKVRTLHATAHAAEAIAEVAEREKHDLVVLGSHGHTSLANVLLGSVASGVLARCKVPLLLIR